MAGDGKAHIISIYTNSQKLLSKLHQRRAGLGCYHEETPRLHYLRMTTSFDSSVFIKCLKVYIRLANRVSPALPNQKIRSSWWLLEPVSKSQTLHVRQLPTQYQAVLLWVAVASLEHQPTQLLTYFLRSSLTTNKRSKITQRRKRMFQTYSLLCLHNNTHNSNTHNKQCRLST